ncbi:hypothetical protein, partial [Acetobacterium tundrae]
MNELSDIFKIKWNNFYIQGDVQTSFEADIFEIMPKDFLKFAKSDTQITEIKGKISVVANAKRAIDCQTDYILAYLGYDYKNLNLERYPEVQIIIDEFNTESNCEKNIAQKLKIIQALGISPVSLINRTRKVRNKLEHEYSIPKNNEILEAVELADLFINTTSNIVIHEMITDYAIQN